MSSKKVKRRFVKMHLSLERERNLILIGFSTKGWKGDYRFGVRMLERIRAGLRRSEAHLDKVLADCGHTSRKMASIIGEMDSKPFLKIKANHTTRRKGSKEWSLMIEFQRDARGVHEVLLLSSRD